MWRLCFVVATKAKRSFITVLWSLSALGMWFSFLFFQSLYHKIAACGGYIKRWESENPLAPLEIVYMVQEGGDFWSFQWWCSRPKSCCIPIWPQLSLCIPFGRLVLYTSSLSFLLDIYFPEFYRILNCWGYAWAEFPQRTCLLFSIGSLERELGRHAKLWNIWRQHGWSS